MRKLVVNTQQEKEEMEKLHTASTIYFFGPSTWNDYPFLSERNPLWTPSNLTSTFQDISFSKMVDLACFPVSCCYLPLPEVPVHYLFVNCVQCTCVCNCRHQHVCVCVLCTENGLSGHGFVFQKYFNYQYCLAAGTVAE